MLQDFRESMRGAAKFIVILIAIPFAFFGIESIFFTGASVEEAASIDGERITRLEVARAVQQRRNMIRQQYGELDPSTVSDELLYGPVLQNMAAAKTLENQARATGMAVAPVTTSRLLRGVEIFQEDGKFSKDNYLVYLAQNQYTPQTHRRYIENELLVAQLAQGISHTGFLTDSELQRVLVLTEQSRDFHYLTLPLAQLLDRVELSSTEVESYYDLHQDRFLAPETVVLDYIELKLTDLVEQVELDEAALRAYYEEHLATAEASKRLYIGHIMIESQADGSHTEKLEGAQAALDRGDEFAAVARKYSEDLLTAEQGGEIGEFIAVDVPEAFQEAVVKLDIGQVSPPVEVDSAWHLIKVLREEKTTIGSYEIERESMEGDLRQDIALELMPEKIEQLGDLAYNSDSLLEVAADMGLELKTSTALTRNGSVDGVLDDIGNYSAVLELAFSEDVLDNGYASEVVELSEGSVVVLKVKEHQEERVLELDEVRSQVEDLVKADKAGLELQAQGQGYIKQILSGETVESVATANNLEWQVSLDTRRYTSEVNREVVQQVFELPAVSALPAVKLFVASSGDVIVYSLNTIREGSKERLPPQQISAMQASLSRASANGDFAAYQRRLVADADIELRAFSEPTR